MAEPPHSRTPIIDRNSAPVLDSPEEVLTTMTSDGKRRWMYPVKSKGRFLNRRRVVGFVLVLVYLLMPVIKIGGKPGILLDFAHREFAILGMVFYPTDTLLLMFFMIGTLLSVILFTALLGRVWCGWGCPQTVYLEFVFRPIERLIEGKENVRRRRDNGPWTFDKVWRKTLKLSIYLIISLALAHTFVAYFVGWSNLLSWVTSSPSEHSGFFFMMAITTGLIMFDFTVFREQMCTIACPYARMQSVLLDPDSLIVSYDPTRGEPRGKRSKKNANVKQGDCIDCGACVRTCTTGIDIREGLQMECIACTQCIDACDTIMDRIGLPYGLIRYTSENAIFRKKARILRVRTVIYALLFVGMATALTILISSRGSYDINVGRSVGDPYMVLPDNTVANRLRFRVRNQTPNATSFNISASAPDSVELRIVGATPIELASAEMKRVEVWVVIPQSAFDDGEQEGRFVLEFSDGVEEEVSFVLLGPK